MEIENIDVQQFKSIVELKCYIESMYYSFDDKYDVVSLFRKYYDVANGDDEKERVNWEIEFFSFEILGADVFPYSSSVGSDINKPTNFPDINELQKVQIDYLKKQASETKSSFVSALYNSLLWKSPRGIKNKVACYFNVPKVEY